MATMKILSWRAATFQFHNRI